MTGSWKDTEAWPWTATSTAVSFSNMTIMDHEDFTLPPRTHDRSNVETGKRRDMYTLTFSNRL